MAMRNVIVGFTAVTRLIDPAEKSDRFALQTINFVGSKGGRGHYGL